jgi:hypothetical protein
MKPINSSIRWHELARPSRSICTMVASGAGHARRPMPGASSEDSAARARHRQVVISISCRSGDQVGTEHLTITRNS